MFEVLVWTVTSTKKEVYEAVNFGPVPDKDLLAITLETGEVIVYPFSQIKKYSFKKKE